MPMEDVNAPHLNLKKPPRPGELSGEEDNPYLKEVRMIARARLASDALGFVPGSLKQQGEALGQSQKSGSNDELAASVVKAAIDNSSKLVERANEMADRKDRMAQEVRDKADESQKSLYQLMFGEMTRVSQDLRAVTDRIDKDKVPPQNALSTIKEAKDLLVMLNSEFGNKQAPVAAPPMRDMNIEIQLQQMRESHEINMRKLDLELKKLDIDLQTKLSEMSENKKWKELEWNEKKEFNKGAMSQIGDIAATIVAGIGANKAGAAVADNFNQHDGAVQGKAYQPPNPETPQIQTFKCEDCGQTIAIPDTGSEITCTTPGCGSKYQFTKDEPVPSA
jgi:hypothetical protein